MTFIARHELNCPANWNEDCNCYQQMRKGLVEPTQDLGMRINVINYGGARDIPPVEVKCPMDAFENHIREIGVITVCEWFGYTADSAFTRETICILYKRSYLDDLRNI